MVSWSCNEFIEKINQILVSIVSALIAGKTLDEEINRVFNGFNTANSPEPIVLGIIKTAQRQCIESTITAEQYGTIMNTIEDTFKIYIDDSNSNVRIYPQAIFGTFRYGSILFKRSLMFKVIRLLFILLMPIGAYTFI